MYTITIIGLGTERKDTLPDSVYEKLKQAKHVFTSITDHPVVNELGAEGSIDSLSGNPLDQSTDSFKRTTQLIELAELNPIIYVMTGYPTIEDEMVINLMSRYHKVEIYDSRRFLNDLVDAVKIDPLQGIQLLHSSRVNPDMIQTGQSVFILDVCDVVTAKDLKTTLIRKYPADHKVAIIEAPGNRTEKVNWVHLNELSDVEGDSYMRSLYIPPLILDEQVTSLSTLQYYIDQVTAPGKDPWISEQTPKSLIRYLKEETGELIAAIEKDDTENWMEELGDVLVQILYQTSSAEKEGLFTFEDVLATVNRKIRRRHPHVFDGVEANTPEEVDAIWQRIKREEKRMKDET